MLGRESPGGNKDERVKSNGVDTGGGNNDDFGESLLIPLRRDDDDERGGGGGIGGAPIGKKDDKNGDAADGVGPKGDKKSVFDVIKRFRSSFNENGDS